jgi:hypothetical protein
VYPKYFSDESSPPAWLKALAEVRRMAPRQGYCFLHGQAIIVAIDQHAEATTGNRDYFLDKPYIIGGSRRNGDMPRRLAFVAKQQSEQSELPAVPVPFVRRAFCAVVLKRSEATPSIGALELSTSRPLTHMHEFERRAKPPITKEERETKLQKQRWDAEQALVERKKAEQAFYANFERLRAERLAREAAKS